MNAPAACSLRRRAARVVVLGLNLSVVCGVLLQLTLRDAMPGLAIVYYALPRSILAVLAILSAVASLAKGSRRQAAVWFAASLGMIAWWHAVEWRDAPPPSTATGVSVMYWNVGRGHAGWDAVIRRIEHERPDLVALGETAYPTGEFRALWRERLPDYDISFVGGGMMCLVRGTSRPVQVRQIDGYTQARELDVSVAGAEFRCLIVDVYAFPLYDRRPALSKIAQVADQSADHPLLILGDFNTPTESLHFRELRRRHVNAFEQSGTGYSATWPAFAPVLSLDQVWANPLMEVLECRHGRTSASDHRPVLLTVRPRPSTPPVQSARN